MSSNVYVWIIVMALATGATRILPLTLIRKPIENQFIQSFLYYVPYVTLAVMTFPAIMDATQIPLAGALALIGEAFAFLPRNRSCLLPGSSNNRAYICIDFVLFHNSLLICISPPVICIEVK